MRLHLTAFGRLVACAGTKPLATVPILDGPALVLDGALLSCRVGGRSTSDTGCAALGILTLRAVTFLPDTEAVRYFGSATRHGAYIAQSPSLDTTPIPRDGRVTPLAVIVDGTRFACLARVGGDDARRLGKSGFACPPLETLSPEDVDRVEVVKPHRSIELFGRDGAAGALVVTLKPRS